MRVRPVFNQEGVALLWTVVAALIVSVVAAVSLNAGWATNANSQITNSCASQLVASGRLVESMIAHCAMDYPTGNNGTAFRLSYPAGATAVDVNTLTCPGSGQNLSSGTNGIALPANINSTFSDWYYINDVTSLRIYTTTSAPAKYGACLTQAQKFFGAGESVINSGTFTVIITQ